MERRRERFQQIREDSIEDITPKHAQPRQSWAEDNAIASTSTSEPIMIMEVPETRIKKHQTEEVVTVHVHHDSTKDKLKSGDDVQSFDQSDPLDKGLEESYKEKMRKKIRLVKAQARADSHETQEKHDRIPIKPVRKRLGDQSEAKNLEDEREIERRKHLKEMWQKRVTKIIDQVKGKSNVSSEVSYDFFTRIWDEEEEEQVSDKVEPERRRSSDEVPDIESLAEAIQLLRNEYFSDDKEWEVYKKVKAQYVPHAVRLAGEESTLFVPSSRSAQPNSRQIEARNLEDEGFYVGAKPYVPPWNLNKIENRLIKYNVNKIHMYFRDEINWFGEDGKVKALPSPLREYPVRAVHENDPSLEEKLTIFRKPQLLIQQAPPSSEFYSQLNVDVSSLVFLHHPLFSLEFVLASHLREVYRKYADLIEKDVVGCLTLRLKATKDALAHLEANRERLESTGIRKRSDIYRTEIKKLRQNKSQIENDQRSLLKTILSTWLELKNLRERQGYTRTTVHLTIAKDNERNVQEDVEEKIEEELEFERERFNESYQEELDAYHEKLHRWKEWRKARKRALKSRKKRNQRKGNEAVDSVSEDDHFDEEEPEEPIPPDQFDEADTKEYIRENMARSRRKTTDGKIKLEMDDSTPLTPIAECPSKERKRLTDASKISIGFQIYFNGKEVCKSTFKQLSEDFSVSWRNIFSIRIYNEPENICVKLLETFGASTKTLSDIFLAIPEEHATSDNCELSEMEFTSELIVTSRNNAVGSGVRVPSEVVGNKWLLTNGVLNCGVSWAVDEEGRVMCPKPRRTLGVLENLKSSDLKSRESSQSNAQMAKLVEEGQIDPNDPGNAILMESLQRFEKLDDDVIGGESVANTYFRLNPLEDVWDFVSEETMDQNARFYLLQLRAKESGDFHNYQMVPAHEKDIPKDVLDAIWKTNSEEDFVSLSRKDRTLNLVNKVREQVMQSYLSSQHERTLEDMVVEEQIPSIGTLGFNLLQLTRRRRPLRPIRKERKKMTGQGITSTEVKIMVTVMRGMNVPVRSDPDTLKSTRKMSLVPFKLMETEMTYESQVRPFVEIMFQRQTTRTHVADGPQPTWNEELQLSFKAPNDDYSPSSLEKVKDVIYLNLFDEVVLDLIEDDRERENTIHQKLERRWLGTLKIPFSTLYLNTKIEGTFQVDTPSVLLGYEQEAKPWIMGMPESDTVSCATYLSLFFTLEPSLQLPDFKDKAYKCENPFLRLAEEWQTRMSSRYHPRPIKAIALDLGGNWTFITRYLKPLAPPEELLENGRDQLETAELLARFVSLIPSSPDSVHPNIKCDIWLTCDQFLQVLTGDEEEHAILLCNFFLHLKKKAFLLLGSGIPEGETAYVLTKENNGEMWCWNSATGIHFNIRDSYCPLQRVGCIVSPNNIWTNIQKHDHPSRMNFNLNKSKDWHPFFNKKNLHPGFASVQPDSLSYKPTNVSYVEEIEDKLDNVLRESIMRWRRRFRTIWNRYCNKVLRNVLPKLEINVGRTASLDSLEQLDPIIKSHKMSGFPLNMVYTDVDAVTDAVFATGVHLAEGKDLEFALAVYVHPYPCEVLAVWIYVATLEKR